MTPPRQPFSLRLLEQLAETIQTSSIRTPNPCIVSVSGGSSTGKTTQIALGLQKILGKTATILSQDNFQRGKPFVSALQSPYKWDDPRNFAFEEEIAALQALKQQKTIDIPIFSVPEAHRIGWQTFHVAPIIIFEGIYTSCRELLPYSQFHIYVEAPLFARLVRRVLRFTKYYGIPDKKKAVARFLTSVLLAHNEYVMKQRETADIIIQTDFDYDAANKLFQLENDLQPVKYDKEVYRFTYENNLSLSLFKKEGRSLLSIVCNDQSFFTTPISEELAAHIKELDFLLC